MTFSLNGNAARSGLVVEYSTLTLSFIVDIHSRPVHWYGWDLLSVFCLNATIGNISGICNVSPVNLVAYPKIA